MSSFPEHNYAKNGNKYPYIAQSPKTGEMVTFNSKEDVEQLFCFLYDEARIKSPKKVGESVYLQGAFFYDMNLMLEQEMQDTILEYTFCKKFNTPPYPSMQETPENLINDFMVIESEFNSIQEHKQGKANGNK